MSDIARPYPPAAAPAGYAADSRPEAPRQYAAGAEPHGVKDAARHGGDTAK